MSETKHRLRAAATPAWPRFQTADECIYALPTLDEVRAAGYHDAEAMLERVTRERAELVARFNSDPAFAAEARAEAAAAWERWQREKAEREKDRP